MREFHNHYDFEVAESNVQIYNRFKMFVLRPIIIGLFTFSIFFTIILFTKILMFMFNEHVIFSLNIYDLLFALIGFGLGFILDFVLKVRKLFLK